MWLVLFYGLFIVLLFIALLILIMKSRFTLLKVYLTIVSLVAVIGMAIGYWVAIYNGIQSAVISDEEYINGRGMRYQFDVCTQPKYVTSVPSQGEQPITPTAEEIAECEEKARTTMMAERNYNTKESVTGGLVWGSIALILFIIHYPKLFRAKEEE